MRMRKKPNLHRRVELCAGFMVTEPEELRGKWLAAHPQFSAVDVEIGCGKGKFTVGMAENNPEILFLAVERIPEAIVVAMERAVERGLQNALFLLRDAGGLQDIFAPEEVRRVYLNFCDPWPKNRNVKRRLTHGSFLRLYAEILSPRGEIHFKTDNAPLFEFSLREFRRSGYELIFVTRDLHERGPQGIMTDYEERFASQGVKINMAIARKI